MTSDRLTAVIGGLLDGPNNHCQCFSDNQLQGLVVAMEELALARERQIWVALMAIDPAVADRVKSALAAVDQPANKGE